MKTLHRFATLTLLLAGAILATGVQTSAQNQPPGQPILLGTTGACFNSVPGGPCTQKSTLVQLDPQTGALIREIGPVGYTVNGLAWDCTAGNCKSGTLYATTAIGDVSFHGLITIDPNTGQGTPVNASVVNFGLSVDPGSAGSPVHSITVDSEGNMDGWYDEFGPGVTDTFVRIDKHTGIATEFNNTGINTSQNGLSYSDLNVLWNIDSPKFVNGALTQTAYILDPSNGQPVLARALTPPVAAALGDFNPISNQYYGLFFDTSFPSPVTFIMVVNLRKGTVTTLGQTVDNLHTLAFMKDHP
ncbi:MAG: hypothetical protein ACXVJ0_07925 [Candidatus Angelobacter sp.]